MEGETTTAAAATTTEIVDPLELLYLQHRECVICLVDKPEHEFAYSLTCPHVFCKDCINKNDDILCMLCRSETPILTHICKIGLTYNLRVWKNRLCMQVVLIKNENID